MIAERGAAGARLPALDTVNTPDGGELIYSLPHPSVADPDSPVYDESFEEIPFKLTGYFPTFSRAHDWMLTHEPAGPFEGVYVGRFLVSLLPFAEAVAEVVFRPDPVYVKNWESDFTNVWETEIEGSLTPYLFTRREGWHMVELRWDVNVGALDAGTPEYWVNAGDCVRYPHLTPAPRANILRAATEDLLAGQVTDFWLAGGFDPGDMEITFSPSEGNPAAEVPVVVGEPELFDVGRNPTVVRYMRAEIDVPGDALGLYDVTVTCGPIEDYTMEKAVNVLKIEYVTKGDAGELLEQSFTYNAVPRPKITADVTSADVAANGTVTMTITGHVTDDTSDLIDTPSKQLQSLDVRSNGQLVQTIGLTNVASPEYPWKPYNFQSQQFTATVQCAVGGLGEGVVTLTTSENAAGCASSLCFGATVYEQQKTRKFNVEFPTGQASGSMVFYVGEDRPGVENELLEEMPPGSGVFRHLLFWADVEVQMLSFAGLTPQLDSLIARMSFTYSNGSTETHELTFFETGPTDSRFCATVSRPLDGLDLGGYLNLVLPPAFDPGSADMCRMYIGDRAPGAEDFLLGEIEGSASLKFNGDATWADATVRLVGFTPLTPGYDTMQSEWVFLHSDGTQEVLNVQMTEAGAPDSCRFVYDLGVKNMFAVLGITAEASSDPGTFFPTIIRIKAAPGVFEESDLRFETFNRTWNIKGMDFGDGEFLYVVDDQQHAVVFNPAAYAQSHIQTGPANVILHGTLTHGGRPVATRTIRVENGLVVADDDVTSMLGTLTNWQKQVESVGPRNYYIYKTAKDQTLGHTDNATWTEVLWRYVGTFNTVAVFESRAELETDIIAREYIINAAKTARFALGNSRFNHDYWERPWIVKMRGGTASATDAIAHMWTAPADYRMKCFDGAQFVTQRGISRALGRAVFDASIGRSPYSNRFKVKKTRTAQPGEEANWIPGDWGYIDNTSPTAGGDITGENVIYLGGCFHTSAADFKANADFWGHGQGVKKMNAMIAVVEGWSGDGVAVVKEFRDYPRLPPVIP